MRGNSEAVGRKVQCFTLVAISVAKGIKALLTLQEKSALFLASDGA